MEKKKRLLLQLVLGGLAGAAVGYCVAHISLTLFPKESLRRVFYSPTGPAETLIKAILGLVALWAALATHELGHLVTGLAQGFRFHLYIAGFLGVRRNPITDRIEWYLNRDAQVFGGVAATLPTQQTTDLRQRFARIVIAGPLISLLTGGLIFWLTYPTLTAPSIAISVLLRCSLVFGLIFSLASIALFLATTLPNRTGVFYTDRARFFRLIRGGQTSRIEQAVLETLAHSMSGQPYGELDKQQIELLLTEKEAFFRTYAHTLAYYRHLDRHELPEAYQHIQAADELATEQPQLFKQEIWKELAFAHAFIGQDVTQATKVWQRIKPNPEHKTTPQAFLVKAAISLAEQVPAVALQYSQHGLDMLPKPVYKAEDRLYANLFTEIITSAKRYMQSLQE